MNVELVAIINTHNIKEYTENAEGDVLTLDSDIGLVLAVDKDTKNIVLRNQIASDLPFDNVNYQTIQNALNMGDTLTNEELVDIASDMPIHSVDVNAEHITGKFFYMKPEDKYTVKPNYIIGLEHHLILPNEVVLHLDVNVTMDKDGKLGIRPISHKLFSDDKNLSGDALEKISNDIESDNLNVLFNEHYNDIIQKVIATIKQHKTLEDALS